MHNINFTSYPENINHDTVQKDWNNLVKRECYQEGATSISPIRWLTVSPRDNYEEAEEYINAHDKGWYDCLAVQYLSYPEDLSSAKLKSLKAKNLTLYKDYQNKSCKVYYRDAKNAFVGCKKCGSKLSTAFIKLNYCPLCGEDLRTETYLKTLQVLKDKLNVSDKEIANEIHDLQIKSRKKAKLMWLVKTEYHT